MTPEKLESILRKTPTFVDPDTGFTLDVSGMDLDAGSLAALVASDTDGQNRLTAAHREMQRIEAGDIKNPDEQRQVTHFTDRISYPDSGEFRDVEHFAEAVREDSSIDAVIVNGIGGSALGPQLMQFALRGPYWNELSPEERGGRPRIYFTDNTDPAGVKDILATAAPAETLVVTVSKSGGTKETRNNMMAFEQAFAEAAVAFAPQAVAVTMQDSKLWRHASENGWRNIFPMAESIGGRTSQTNVVGHVPAALAGINFRAFLAGARHMDTLTRNPELTGNPAYQLAVAWYAAGNGRGDRNMVVVPYADRLVLLARYLQQLVMESLGKETDRDGNTVHQGLTVYGNKGGTDAHAYIQQLNDGRDDFFLTLVETLQDAASLDVDDGLTMGDYLHAFKEGLATALRAKKRKLINIEIERLDEPALGMLIALYERAVAAYAEFININAFHQPGVEAYKKASENVNRLSRELQAWLSSCRPPWSGTAADVAGQLGAARRAPEVERLLARAAVNRRTFEGKRVVRAYRDGMWRFTVQGC